MSVGAGASSVLVLRRPGRPRVVVIFAHGWKTTVAPAGATWADQFRPWLDHLLARRAAIVFPRYQIGGVSALPASVQASFLVGVRRGFDVLGRPAVPVIAVGYSYGASLLLAYSGKAKRLRLPAPAAVDAIFPAAPLPGEDASAIPATTRVLIQVGDADTDAGSSGADAFWQQLAAHPAALKRYVVVRSQRGLVAVHAAPKLSSAAARAAFWAPLDNLIALALAGR